MQSILAVLLSYFLLSSCATDAGHRNTALSGTHPGCNGALSACKRGYYAKAYRELEALAEQGHSGAQDDLGMVYYQGESISQSYAEALKRYHKAAEQGSAEAQFNLGAMYYKGEGVPQSYGEAAKWYRKAAEQGHTGAQNNLGVMCFNGLGVQQDKAEALRWYGKAAKQGLAEAQFNLGEMYDEGEGVPKERAESVKWYRKAAEQGYVPALSALGIVNPPDSVRVSKIEIPLERRGGIYELPVKVNGAISLRFVLDSGASDVMIPADVAFALLKAGTISKEDFLPGKSYRLADGSILKSSRLMIRELDLGSVKISRVPAGIVPAPGPLLLGQSFLSRLESWALDNKRDMLVIDGAAAIPR